MQRNNFILIGLPASGKTTVGRALSAKLGIKFIDLDFLIEQKEGLKISSIFEKFGEKYFRELETKNLKNLFSEKESFILSTGGGTVEKNIEILLELGAVFYLKISPKAAYNRIKGDKTRPLLQKENPLLELENIFEKRKNFYERANFCINAQNGIQEIADRIIY
ncbi:MAG: shikimate kinase, partial [Candidatus Gastranaerophilales bacterium]|nr:shikimate kinase [Candidatus Gastranaerophilales bacterium]